MRTCSGLIEFGEHTLKFSLHQREEVLINTPQAFSQDLEGQIEWLMANQKEIDQALNK